MIGYIAYVSVLLFVMFFFYWSLLRKETFYKLNRYFLTAAIGLALLIPLIPVPSFLSLKPSVPVAQVVIDQPNPSALSNDDIVGTDDNSIDRSKEEIAKPITATITERIDLRKAMSWIYIVGVIVFALNFLIQLIILLIKKSKLEYIQDGKFKIYELKDESSPFSFMTWIFINPALYDLDTYNQILEHEKIHVSQAHYLDKMLAELAVIFSWFNPAAWLHRKAITNNLEFLTDYEMLSGGTERESYQLSLLKVSVPQHALDLTTNYNESFLTERIKMMNSKKSSARSSWKYLLVLPLLGLFMASLNAVAQPDDQVVTSVENTDVSPVTIDTGEIVQSVVHSPDMESHIEVATENLEEHISAAKADIPEKVLEKEKHKSRVKTESKTNRKDESKVKLYQQSELDAIEPGQWMAKMRNNKICFYLDNSDLSRNHNWTTHICFDPSEIKGFKDGQDVKFSITRAPGSLLLDGDYSNNRGMGDFEFVPDEGFYTYLKGITGKEFDKKNMFQLFLNNTDKAFIEKLKKRYGELSYNNIMSLGIHVRTDENLQELYNIADILNNENPSIDQLVEMAIHNVTEDYVKGIIKLDADDVSYRKVVSAKIHNVTPEYVQKIRDFGYKDVSLSKATEMKIHNFDVDELKKIKAMGFEDITMRESIEFAIHNVSVDGIEQIRKAGYTNLSPRDHISFAIHNVTPDHVEDLKKLGYGDLSASRLLETKIHNISPDYIKRLKAYGFTDLSMNKIIEFKIHNLTPSYMEEIKALGFTDLSTRDFLDGKIHDVSPRYIKEMRALNIKGMTFSKLKEARIHRVGPSFVKRVREKGFKPETLAEYIKIKIIGLD